MNNQNLKAAALYASAAAALLVDLQESDEQEPGLNKKLWIKKWRRERFLRGSFSFLMMELQSNDIESFKNYLRMNEDFFNEILQHIETDLKKCDTMLRAAISPKEKLAVTLRFLATGESFQSLEYQTRLSRRIISEAVNDTCSAIYKRMQPIFLKVFINSLFCN